MRSDEYPLFFNMLIGVLVTIFLNFVLGCTSSRLVTLGSIEIFTTHEYFGAKPSVYFQCHGENVTFLPDVKQKYLLYSFKGEESWQPLTDLPDRKCKRCGLYEDDSWKPDDVFDEWELCPDDFEDGEYFHFKEHEFNASFICLECKAINDTGQHDNSISEKAGKKVNAAFVVIVSVLCSLVTLLAALGAYKYWQKRKREQEQARFLKLFDDSDDIEDELGLGPM